MYIPGDRLWVRKPPSTVWWPAKVLSNEDLAQITEQPLPEGSDFGVLYYAGTTTEASLDFMLHSDSTDVVVPFESSSEKAVSSDEDLKAAISAAADDVLANPLKGVMVVSAKRALDQDTRNQTQPPKRRATEDRGRGGRPKAAASAAVPTDDVVDGTDNDSRNESNWCRLLEDDVCLDVAAKLRAATNAKDFSAARRQLLRLDRVALSLEQLYSTRIGVAVGDVLGVPELQGLWPLARAFCSWWAQLLPQATRDAIQYVQDVDRREQESHAAAQSLGVAPSSSTVALSAPPQQGLSLREKLVAALQVEADTVAELRAASPDFAVTAIVTDLLSEILNLDQRRWLLLQLQKPGHFMLRRQMLKREVNGAAFLRFTPSELLTEEERVQEEAKLAATLKAIDEASKPSVVTELFTCKSCKTNRCSFHEQQTRGADEPTTKFITCLNCGSTWTEE